MQLGRFRLLFQRGAGWDGVVYRAEDESGAAVEVRLLSGARLKEERWQPLLERLREARLLEHPGAARILELSPTTNPPYVAIDAGEGVSLHEHVDGKLPLPWQRAVGLVADIASACAEAHRIGLSHGRLEPSSILITRAGAPRLDFTGTEAIFSLIHDLKGLSDWAHPPEGNHAPAADVFDLASLLAWLVTGKPTGDTLALDIPADLAREIKALIDEARQRDPEARPSARTLHDRLEKLLIQKPIDTDLQNTSFLIPDRLEAELEAARDTLIGKQLGRFLVQSKIGEGGMGAVYRAADLAHNQTVAIKVLRPELLDNPRWVRRFLKEARMLAEVHNPFVANLLEVNEDQGIHYIALELVEGANVARLIADQTKLKPELALAIAAGACRALEDAHARGIIHRDIKPDNILLVDDPSLPEPRVKLLDFGLARQVVQSDSLQMTQAGTVMGTPYYMSPEQGGGKELDPRADVYALGATLYHMLAGQPPFTGEDAVSIILAHATDPVPDLTRLVPEVGDGVWQLVKKALAKSPEERYANASALLADIERLRRGEPTHIALHPRLPASNDPNKVLKYDFTWELEASPMQLWPHVSNTERLNRAIGLSAVDFANEGEEESRRLLGRFQFAGMVSEWQEHPFEWIEGRRMGVLREFRRGVFKWFVSIVEMTPRRGGGTTLTHSIRLEPANLLGRTVAAVEVGIKAKKSLARVYKRIDEAVLGKLGPQAVVDPFETPAALSGARQRRLQQALDKVIEQRVSPLVAEQLGTFLSEAADQEVSRIRPRALARRLGLDEQEVIAACLHGAHEGLLLLFWDILCPVCRIPAQIQETLRNLKDHGRCEACNLDFELDFANSVEMIFRAHPEIRAGELGTYCIGGPAHSPHVAAQARVAAGERMALELNLGEGAYRLRGPQLAWTLDFRVDARAPTAQWEFKLSRGLDAEQPRSLKPGKQLLALTNDFKQEALVRVERTAPRDDCLTAARAASLALFRELFPAEVLAPGQLIGVANVSLMITSLCGAASLYDQLGDHKAFAVIHEHFTLLGERIAKEGGAVVKAVGEGLVATFHEPLAAVRAAVEFGKDLSAKPSTHELRVSVAVHRGPALVATLNDHLDYFGSTVNLTSQLIDLARAGEVVLSQPIAGDPPVAEYLQAKSLQLEAFEVKWKQKEELAHRVRVTSSLPAERS